MLLQVFEQPKILMAMDEGFHIDCRKWPLKDGYPAVTSKHTQVLTFSLSYFEVSVVYSCPSCFHAIANIEDVIMTAHAPWVHTL